MAELRLHKRKLDSVFELLGYHEDDITYSIGWALSQSQKFLNIILDRMFPGIADYDIATIRLQEHKKKRGRTDMELEGPDIHAIVEAKRGWWLPDEKQMNLYAGRLRDKKRKALVVMAECSRQFAECHLPETLNGIPVRYLSWKEIFELSQFSDGTHAEKRLMGELRTYLERIVRMQNQESNIVYCVVLARGTPSWSKISWKDVVNVKGRYFHPAGIKGWPKEPPNYMGFRYDGKLHSIHHVDSWKIVDELHQEIPEIDPGKDVPHYIYTLGPPITPPKEIRNGNIYVKGRYRIMLDLLLTCDTIQEARDMTQKRLSEAW